MGRKRRDDKQEADQLTERMVLVAERIWHGNQARMADELNVSPPVISRVLTGQQQPTGKLLAGLLSRRPELNLHWLLTGQGEPFLDPSVPVGGGRFRPVVDHLLPGPPGEHPGLLSGLGYPVAEAFHSTTSYWYRVPTAAPVVGSSEKVAADDKLLIECGAKFTRRLAAVLGKLCAFRVVTGRRQRVVLGKVGVTSESYIEAFERFHVKLFGESGEAWLLVADSAADLEEAGLGVSGVCLVLGQVAGVCVKLERPFGQHQEEGRRGAAHR